MLASGIRMKSFPSVLQVLAVLQSLLQPTPFRSHPSGDVVGFSLKCYLLYIETLYNIRCLIKSYLTFKKRSKKDLILCSGPKIPNSALGCETYLIQQWPTSLLTQMV